MKQPPSLISPCYLLLTLPIKVALCCSEFQFELHARDMAIIVESEKVVIGATPSEYGMAGQISSQ